MNKHKGFTIVEVLIVLAVTSLLIGFILNFMSRSFKYSQIETKNIDAIQEMALIINYLRYDLRVLYEDPFDESTYAIFDDSSKKLEFNIISGIAENNMKIFSKVTYFSDNKFMYRTTEVIKNSTKKEKTVTKLAVAANIKDFKVNILNGNGTPVSTPRSIDTCPAFFKVNLIHANNKRLDMNIDACITHMAAIYDDREIFKVADWKIKTVDSNFLLAKTSMGNMVIDLFEFARLLKFDQTRHGINSGTPQFLQKPITKLHEPFGGINPNRANPYTQPPPPPPPPAMAMGGGGGNGGGGNGGGGSVRNAASRPPQSVVTVSAPSPASSAARAALLIVHT